MEIGKFVPPIFHPDMLHNPNPNASAPNIEAYSLFKNNKREYQLRVLAEAQKYSIYM